MQHPGLNYWLGLVLFQPGQCHSQILMMYMGHVVPCTLNAGQLLDIVSWLTLPYSLFNLSGSILASAGPEVTLSGMVLCLSAM